MKTWHTCDVDAVFELAAPLHCAAGAPVAFGSPKFHENWTMLWPCAAFDPSALKMAAVFAVGDPGDTTKSAVGTAGSATVIACEVDAEPPVLFVTVSVVTKVPPLPNACVVDTPVPLPPSPKVHAYETMVLVGVVEQAPAESISAQLVLPSNETVCPTGGEDGRNVNAARGVLTGGLMTPCGTRRSSTTADCALDASLVVGVSIIWTQVPMTVAEIGDGWHAPTVLPGAGAAGDVNVTVAVPFELVT